MSASTVLFLFLLFFAAEFLIERALALLNERHVRANRGAVPEAVRNLVTPETYAKSVEYTLARAKFGHVVAVIDAVMALAILFSGVLPWLDARISELGYGELKGGVILMLVFGIGSSLLHLPVAVYSTFMLEARFGFNKTTPTTFVADRIKGLLLTVLIGGPFLYGLLAFVTKTGPLWWLWAALFMVGFQLIMLVLYPLVISPLFNKFTPLPEGELKARLENLAQHCDFAVRGIFVMDGSKRSAHSNAYFTGIGKGRRIVLFDTLCEQLSVAELAAVLAHEIGHYKRKHILKTLAIGVVLTLVGFCIFSLLLDWPPLYAAFGLTGPSIALKLLLFALISGAFTFWIGPFMNALSRKHEYEADAYAAEQTHDAPAMAGALLKLHEKNLSNLTPHPAFSAWHYSHPTLLERLGALRRIGASAR